MKLLVIIGFMMSITAFSQTVVTDTINVIMTGLYKGEKYRIYYNGALVKTLNCKSKIEDGTCDFEFKLIGKIIQSGDLLPLFIFRKGRFGLIYRETKLSILYNPHYKYLRIYRNFKFKNKYSIDYKWINEKPMYD
jgi:hypothetical protein